MYFFSNNEGVSSSDQLKFFIWFLGCAHLHAVSEACTGSIKQMSGSRQVVVRQLSGTNWPRMK